MLYDNTELSQFVLSCNCLKYVDLFNWNKFLQFLAHMVMACGLLCWLYIKAMFWSWHFCHRDVHNNVIWISKQIAISVTKIFIFYIMAIIGFRESQTTSLVNKHMLSLYFHKLLKDVNINSAFVLLVLCGWLLRSLDLYMLLAIEYVTGPENTVLLFS